MTAAPARTAAALLAGVVVAVVITVLSRSSAFLVIRGVAPHFSGGALALGRLLISSALLSLMLIGKRWVRPRRGEWMLILVFGVAWFGAYNVALNTAEQRLDAGTVAMIVDIGPILIALGAGLFLGEGVPRWLAIGAGVAFLGVVSFAEVPSMLAMIGGVFALVGVALSRHRSSARVHRD